MDPLIFGCRYFRVPRVKTLTIMILNQILNHKYSLPLTSKFNVQSLFLCCHDVFSCSVWSFFCLMSGLYPFLKLLKETVILQIQNIFLN